MRMRALRQFTLSTGKSAGRNSSGRMRIFRQGMFHVLIRISIVFFLLAVCYFCMRICSSDVFQAFFWKIGLSLGGRAVSFALCKLGCAGGLALAIVCAVRALLSSEAAPYLGNMMLPTGGISGEDRQIHAGVAHHSPANPASEGTSGTKLPLPSSASSPVPSLSSASDSWIEKCYGDPAEASSSPPDDRGPRQQGEGALFQPTPPYDLPQPPRVVEQAGPSQIAPPSPSSTGAGPANAFPEVDQPLLADGERRQKLEERLAMNDPLIPPEKIQSIVDTQLDIEKKIEEALLSDGFERESLKKNLDKIRGILFYPRGKPLSESTYSKHLHQMESFGTPRSLPYQRIMGALLNYDLVIEHE